jgi:hypothetical protein
LHEKEQIMRGQMPVALSTDNHARHIREHAAIANNPAVRADANLLKIITEHNFEHLRLARTTDPMLMAMADTGMMPQGGAPPPPGPGTGMPPPEGGNPGGGDIPMQGAPEATGTPALPTGPASDALGR